jgi:hypothetical protein
MVFFSLEKGYVVVRNNKKSYKIVGFALKLIIRTNSDGKKDR